MYATWFQIKSINYLRGELEVLLEQTTDGGGGLSCLEIEVAMRFATLPDLIDETGVRNIGIGTEGKNKVCCGELEIDITSF